MIDMGLVIGLLLLLILLVLFLITLMLFHRFYPEKYRLFILGEKRDGGEKEENG